MSFRILFHAKGNGAGLLSPEVKCRVNWTHWVLKWATQLGYLFGYSKETNLSRLLKMLLRLSIIRPINKIVKNHLGSEWRTSWKMNKNIKLNLPWDFSDALYPCGSFSSFRRKYWPQSNFQHLQDNFFILSIKLFNKKINWRRN